MAENPFSPTSTLPNERGVFGTARQIRSGFLFRVIDFDAPMRCRLVYDGWWFRQKIEINGEVAWFQISWLRIHRRITFQVPAKVKVRQPEGKIEIEFGRSLMIRRFRIWIGGQMVYDEIN